MLFSLGDDNECGSSEASSVVKPELLYSNSLMFRNSDAVKCIISTCATDYLFRR